MLNAQVGRAKEGQELLRQQLADVQIELDTIYEVGNGYPLKRMTRADDSSRRSTSSSMACSMMRSYHPLKPSRR
jgi:hypothetical protein